jgi:RNA polymerase sigma factor (sigma-70 family)
VPVLNLRRALWTEYLRQVRSSAAERRWRAHRERRRETLIVEHLEMVDRIARRVVRCFSPKLDIQDFVQAGRVGLIEAADRYRPAEGPFEAFAYRRVRGAMIDAHKRRAYREELHDSVEGIQERLGFLPARMTTDPSPLPDELVADREVRLRVVEVARRRLPQVELEVFEATMAGRDLHQIAEQYGRSVTWARTKLAAARQVLAAALRDRAA